MDEKGPENGIRVRLGIATVLERRMRSYRGRREDYGLRKSVVSDELWKLGWEYAQTCICLLTLQCLLDGVSKAPGPDFTVGAGNTYLAFAPIVN